MHAAELDLPPISSLPLLIDPSVALMAAHRLAATCPTRQRHSALLGRLVSASEAERLDRQREEELRRHAGAGGIGHGGADGIGHAEVVPFDTDGDDRGGVRAH